MRHGLGMGESKKLARIKHAVNVSHGGGGRASARLIESVFFKYFDNPWLNKANDQAVFTIPAGRMVMSTDAHVISPLFFPGGDIGSLAVNGTVNDVCMSGAKPLYLSASFILEEGLELSVLERVVMSMADAAKKAGVAIVTGDTKVVERGKGDGIFITTTGVGVLGDNLNISAERAQAGDAIILSGSIGDHGVAVMATRENLEFETQLLSDCAALNTLVEKMVAVVPDIHCMRDPTRGGLAATLNEFAQQSRAGMLIYEDRIPVKEDVHAACELLGLDPLNVANEGKLVCICPREHADELVQVMKAHPLGKEAAVIGEVLEDEDKLVQMQTRFGGRRLVDWIAGEQLPRIC